MPCFRARLFTLAWCAGMGLGLIAPPAGATVTSIDLAIGNLSADGFGLRWQRNADGGIEGPSGFYLAVGWYGAVSARSALDFSIARLPDNEKVVSAVLSLRPNRIGIQGLQEPVGSIVHLDAATPIPAFGSPNPGPSDARRFTWDAVGAAPFATSLGLGGSFATYNPFDVTAAVKADHAAGQNTSPFGLLEEPRRRFSLGFVEYSAARLTVTTAAPDPVHYALTSLGGDRFRAHYDLRNELSLPLGLLDINFDPALYAEDSLSFSLTGAARDGWSAQWLASGIGVPAVLSLAANGSGLGAGQQAAGFDVDFTWRGPGRPGAQGYTVYDPTSFDALYSGLTVLSAVPELSTPWLLLAGLGLLGLRVAGRRLGGRRVGPTRWRIGALLLGALAAVPAWAVPDLVVSGYQLQATRRLGSTLYEYTYKVSATNRGTAASGVEAQVSAVRSGLVPTAGTLYFGRVGAGQTVVSDDAFVIRHDRRQPFTRDDLVWRFVASDASFSGRFEGPAATPVATLLRNYLDDTPYRPAAVDVDPGGRRLLRTDLTLTLAAGVSVGQLQPALDAVNAVVIGSLVDRPLIVVRIPDPGSVPGLLLVRDRLAATPGIEGVELAVFPKPLLLPSNPAFTIQPPATEPNSGALDAFLAHHLAIRAAAAWNLESRLNRPPTGTPMLPLPLLIIIDAFGNGPPQAADGFRVLFSPRDYATGQPPDPQIGDRPGGWHGYEVLGQMLASFGGDDSPLGDFTGLVPATDRQVVVRAVDLLQLGPAQSWLKALLSVVAAASAGGGNIVVNTSLGSGYTANDDLVCAPSTCVQAAAVNWIKLVRGSGGGSSLENRFLHVVAAGNDPHVNAVDGSFLAHAGAQATVLDKRGTFRTTDDVLLPGLSNTLVVEGRYAAVGREGPTVDCPQGSTGNPDFPSGEFSPGGHVSGIGSVDRGFVLINGIPLRRAAGVYAPYTVAKRSPGANYQTFASGSSVATPQVAGVALLAWAVNAAMTPQQLKAMLIATTMRNQSGPGFGAPGSTPPPDAGCSGPSGFHPTVDAYAAVLAADSPASPLNLAGPADAPARLALLDVASVVNGQLVHQPDGRFTQADLLAFLQQFEARKGAHDYSRYDLNGDGHTGETYAGVSVIQARRFDLDGNLAWTTATRPVLGLPVSFDEDVPADISVLVYYAYSPLYTGNEYERELLLLPYLAKTTQLSPTLDTLRIDVTGIQSTALRIAQVEPQTSAFTSLCPAGERGAYSQAVVAAGAAAGTTPTFWRPRSQGGRITNELPNVDNCSSFIATVAGTGKLWINSAARHQETSNGKDVEYQSRFYLGTPDLAAAAAGTLTPPPGRLATQALSYGVIDHPGAAFKSLGSTRDFKLQAMGVR